MPGRDQNGRTKGAAGLSITTHADAEAGHENAVADLDRSRLGKRGGYDAGVQRGRELEKRNVRRGAVRQQRREIETRMTPYAEHVGKARAMRAVIVDELVVGAWQHAMCCGENEIACNRGTAAEVSARADDQDHVLRRRLVGSRRASDHGVCSDCRGEQDNKESDDFHRALEPRGRCQSETPSERRCEPSPVTQRTRAPVIDAHDDATSTTRLRTCKATQHNATQTPLKRYATRNATSRDTDTGCTRDQRKRPRTLRLSMIR